MERPKSQGIVFKIQNMKLENILTVGRHYGSSFEDMDEVERLYFFSKSQSRALLLKKVLQNEARKMDEIQEEPESGSKEGSFCQNESRDSIYASMVRIRCHSSDELELAKRKMTENDLDIFRNAQTQSKRHNFDNYRIR